MPVERERGIYALRLLAVAVAVLVAGRLLWYPLVFDDPGSTPILNWLLWGYGVPAAAFALAAKLLRERRDDVAVRAFEALAIAYAALLASLEVRHLATGGDLLAQGLTLAEVGAQTSVALAFALGLRRLRDRIPSPVILWGSRVFGYGSLLLIAIALGRTSNPLFSGERVEGGVIFNALLVGYALPALLAALLARAALSRGEWTLGRAAGALSLGLVFLWVTLNVRLFFRGPVLLRGVTEGALRLLGGLAGVLRTLLVAGFATGQRALRLASGAVMLLVVAKVFLVDMAELDGALRAFSFLGLGCVLMAVGFVYQRFLLRPSAGIAS